uniref:PH_3 domain-containing protein n=1 Tax=Pristionchus pacificus TaxID=54126 RepID=A0A2A6D0Z7_PRIPA
VIGASQRLGSPTQPSIMAHPFYEGVNFETIHTSIPPEVLPYVPASMGEPEFYGGTIIVPGFDKDTMMRLERGAIDPNNAFPDPVKPNALELMFGRDVKLNEISIPSATSAPPELQKTSSKTFTEDNLIVHNGFVDKKKGLFARRRMFLITEGPHIYYIDPVNMVYKGQIPICYETKTEIKNFRTFFVHTPERTYYLFDPARRADLWCNEIEKIRGRYFTEPSPPNPDDDIIEITKLFGIIPFITFKTTRAARLAKERKKREQKERKERTEKAKKERLAKEKEEKKERKEKERIEKAQRKAEKEKKRREKKLGRR